MCNDISIIYVTAHRCAGGLKNKFDLRLGSQRHRYFVGFFNVPVQPPTRGQPFYGYSEKPSHLVAFYDTLGIRRTHSHHNPRDPQMEALTMNLKVVSLSPNVGKNFTFCILSTLGPRDFKMRMGPPYPQRVVKGDYMGRFLVMTIKKRTQKKCLWH